MAAKRRGGRTRSVRPCSESYFWAAQTRRLVVKMAMIAAAAVIHHPHLVTTLKVGCQMLRSKAF